MKDTGKDLAEKLQRFSRLMHRYRHHPNDGITGHGPGLDPHRGQGRILALLNLQDGLRQRDIAYTLDIRPQSLGELLVKLESSELIVRRNDEFDRRTQLVYLTDAGRVQARELNKPHGNPCGEVFGVLEESEREALSCILDKLIKRMVDEVGAEPEHGFGGPHHGPHHGPQGHSFL